MATIIRAPAWAASPEGEGVDHGEKVGEAYSDALRPLDRHALAGDEARYGREDGDSMVAGGIDHTPTLRAGGNPTHPEAIMRRLDPDSKWPECLFHALDTVRLLHAQLLGAADDTLPPRAPGHEREERQLVDQPRHLGRPDLGPHELGRRHLEVSDCLPARAAPVKVGDPRAHALEDGEEARPGRVDADAVHAHVRAREERGGDEYGRGRRDVARDLEPERPQALRRPDRGFARSPPHPRARRLEHALRVVASREPLDDHGRAVRRVEPGEKDARLHLRARDRELVANRLERAARALEDERRVSIRDLDFRPH